MLQREESARLQRRLGECPDGGPERRLSNLPKRFGCAPPDQCVLVTQSLDEQSDGRLIGRPRQRQRSRATNDRGGIAQAAGKQVEPVMAPLGVDVRDGLDGQRT